MINYIYGTAGSGKSEFIISKIKEKAQENQKIIAIVPEQYSLQYENKLYDRLGANLFNKISIHSFRSLTRELLEKNRGKSGEYIDDLSKTTLLYKCINISYDSLIYFKKKSKTSGFLYEISDLTTLLRRNEVFPEDILSESLKTTGDLKLKLNDLYYIYNEYCKEISSNHKRDITSDIDEAAASASITEYFKGKYVFFDEFDMFRKDEYNLIKCIISDSENVYFGLLSDDLLNNDKDSKFSIVNDTYKRLKEIDQSKESRRFKCKNNNSKPEEILKFGDLISSDEFKIISSNGYINFYEAKDIYDECEYTAATIRHLIMNDSNLKYKDITILVNNPSDYALQIDASFNRYNIPHNISAKKSLFYMPYIRYISSLFDMLIGKYKSESVLRYAASGLVGLTREEVNELENYVYIQNIDGDAWKNEFISDKSEDINYLRELIIVPIESLKDEISNLTKISEYCEAVYKFILENLSFDELSKHLFSNEKINKSMDYVWNKINLIFDTIYTNIGNLEIKFNEFTSLFLELTEKLSFDFPPIMTDCVEVGNIVSSRVDSSKIVFILGVSDGVFPSFSDKRPIFNNYEIKNLAGGKLDFFMQDSQVNSQAILSCYKSVTIPTQKLYILYPTSSSDITGSSSNKIYRSYIIDIAEKNLNDFDKYFNDSNSIDSEYYSLTNESIHYQYILNKNKRNTIISTQKQFLKKHNLLNDDYEKISKEKINNIILLQKYLGNLYVYPSNLRTYSECPFEFFMKNIVRIYQYSKNEYNGILKGNLIHYILEQILKNNPKDKFINLNDFDIKRCIDKYGNEYINKFLNSLANFNPRMKQSVDDVLNNLFPVVKHIQKEQRQSKFTPVEFELEIGKNGTKTLDIPLENGSKILIGGHVDRIDLMKLDGVDKTAIRVLDYKTRSDDGSLKKSENSLIKDLMTGIDIQTVLYLFSLTYNGQKWDKSLPSGALYVPVGLPKETDNKTDIKSYYCMRGMLTDNIEILKGMEAKLQNQFIDVDSKDIENSPYVLPQKYILYLRDYLFDKIKVIGKNIYSGNFKIDPYEKDMCNFCDYYEVCRNNKYIEKYVDGHYNKKMLMEELEKDYGER